MKKNSKIYIAGHNGMVGSAIVRHLQSNGYNNLVLRNKSDLNLTNQDEVGSFFDSEFLPANKIEYVFLAAAKVGGIMANMTYPAEFIYNNLAIQNNIIHCSYKYKVKKLLFLGSSCIYPKNCKQPIKEEYLLSGSLESTNEPYALAKIAGIKMCQAYNKQYDCNFISVMPCNLYGINDNFDLKTSHVLPALLRKFHEAKINNLKEVTIWGSGKPKREFLNVDDLAEACVFLMNDYNDSEIINIGTGIDMPIFDLARLIKEITDYKGNIITDTSKPDGTMRKLLDVSKINKLGWHSKISLKKGIEKTYSLKYKL